MLSYWRGYAKGMEEGRVQALHEFERLLAVCREEMADLRRTVAEQSHRADSAVDLLLGHLGARAISTAGQQAEAERSERHIRSVEALTSLPDPDAELPYGDPRGRYSSLTEAKIDFEDATTNG